MHPSATEIHQQVAFALQEDMGPGDVSVLLIDAQSQSTARLITREKAVMCGQAWANEVFTQLGDVSLEWQVQEGEPVVPDQVLCLLHGSSRHLLTGERTALNFLQTLMGTATKAHEYKQAVSGSQVTVLDTRKTLPGLRNAQKYAVACGGCQNHRIGLYDAFMIKENHILACGSITAAVQKARQIAPDKRIIVEVETLIELAEATAAKPDQIMLDNFVAQDIAKARPAYEAGIIIEVSGNIDLDQGNFPQADFPICISSGALTKHVRAIDLSMRLV